MNQQTELSHVYLEEHSNHVVGSETENRQPTRHRHQNHTPAPSYEEPSSPRRSNDKTGATTEISHGAPKKIGSWLIFIISACLVALLVAIVFLSWLWFDNRVNPSWRKVMLSGMSTQAITLTGVLIRVAIGTLAVVTTSMIASIAVESHGVPLPAFAEVSIARFTNSGPQSLFTLLFVTTTFKAYLRLLALMLLIVVIAAQFSSTLLVTDLKESRISSLDQMVSYAFTFMDSRVARPLHILNRNSWLRAPTSSEIFAEYSEEYQTADGYEDTGTTIRAFLPFALQSERESLRSFRGMARVFDARVMCISPHIHKAQFFTNNPKEDVGMVGPEWLGITMAVNNTDMPPGNWQYDFDVSKDNETYYFHATCPIHFTMDHGDEYWLRCPAQGRVKHVSSLRAGEDLQNGDKVNDPWLLINIGTILRNRHYEMAKNAKWKHLNETRSGPWLRQWSRVLPDRYMNGSRPVDFQLEMSLCFDNLRSDLANLNITAATTSVLKEPASRYDGINNQYDALAVRNQLGVLSVEEMQGQNPREILTISAPDMEASLAETRGKSDRTTYYEPFDWDWVPRGMMMPEGKYLSFCSTCGGIDGEINPLVPVDSLLANLFTETLNKTDSPALALQAFNTVLARMIYYEQINNLSPADFPATVSRFELTQVPESVRGFVAVVVIIGCNVSLFVIVCIMFLRSTRFSLIGNAWHTVAQVSESADTQELLKRAVLATDKEVSDWVRGDAESKSASQKSAFSAVGNLFKRTQKTRPNRFSVRNGVFTEVEDNEENSSSTTRWV